MRPSAAERGGSPIGFWAAARRRDGLDVGSLRPGLNAVEVVCAAPRYVVLHVVFRDETLAPLLVPLDPVGASRYRKVFSLIGDVRSASLEVMPVRHDGDVRAVRFGPVRWLDLAAVGWRAVRRNVASPGRLVAKARQVAGGGASFVFSGAAQDGPLTGDAYYRNWQIAFESECEASRVRAALAEQIGPRRVRVLAVVAQWPFGDGALAAQLQSLTATQDAEVHVLDLRGSDEGPEAVARAAREAEADLVLFLERPGRFHPLAIPSLMLELAMMPQAAAVYADHDHSEEVGHRHRPAFKPAWSPDYLAAYDYIGQPVAFRGDAELLAAGIGAAAPSCASFALLMGLAAEGAAGVVRHIPRVLFHLADDTWKGVATERQGVERSIVEALAGGRVETVQASDGAESGLRRVCRSSADGEPRVAVVIPSKDNPEMLARACEAVTTAAGVQARVVIVDNGSTSPEQHGLLEELARNERITVVSSPGPFNFSSLINQGRASCDSRVLVLLNDDVEALDTGWLGELATQAMRPDVGAVGAMLLYPDRRVQHAGVVLGINGGSGHAFRFASEDADGEGYRLRVVHEVSAVTGACLAVRAAVFDEVDGFSEDLPVTLNDIDFCLKVRARGYRNLFTPHARLIHRESTSRGLDVTPERLRRLSAETATFRRRWGEQALVDPFYSPHLSPSHEDYRRRGL
jgi:GT2 family glycosyltransferase